jgi:transposase-like protein
MRYPASEKLEIIRMIEQSHLPAKKMLDQLGIARRTFYRWYDRYLEGGPEALEDRPSRPSRVWNRIGDNIQAQIIELALEQSELSPRELAVRFTDEKRYFVSEATVYRLLKAHDLIPSPAFVVIKAADEFKDKTTRPNEMWQTDFTYFKIIGWAGSICRPCSTTSPATSSPGSCARPCGPRMSPTHWNWRSRHQAATAPGCRTSPSCSATTGRLTSRPNSLNGSAPTV